jgi:hypothetical protein
VEDAVEICRVGGGRRIVVSANEHAVPFYERCGFVVDGVVATRFGQAQRLSRDTQPG